MWASTRISGKLHHPSIVTIFDYGITERDQPYIVMELIDGQSVAKKLGRVTAEQFGSILTGAAAGLDYAHARGVVHRDIKPSNLLVTRDGEPKIVDFGIAMLAGSTESRVTQVGTVVGTPYYMSPEQVSGGTVTPAADQLALAVVAFELLTGKTPFGRETTFEAVAAIVTQAPRHAAALNPTLGEACQAVFERALAKKAQERFENCSAFAEALLGSLAAGWQPYSKPTPAIEAVPAGAEKPSPVSSAAGVPGRGRPPRVPID